VRVHERSVVAEPRRARRDQPNRIVSPGSHRRLPWPRSRWRGLLTPALPAESALRASARGATPRVTRHRQRAPRGDAKSAGGTLTVPVRARGRLNSHEECFMKSTNDPSRFVICRRSPRVASPDSCDTSHVFGVSDKTKRKLVPILLMSREPRNKNQDPYENKFTLFTYTSCGATRY